MKNYISDNLYQKCLILCSKILVNLLHNSRLTVLLPWQHGLPSMKGFSGHLWNFILIFTDGASYACSSNHIDKFSELQITKILKSSGWGLQKSELPWEQDFLWP